MAKPDFYLKEGDRAPSLVVTCVDENENVIPLTAAISAKFFMYNPGDDTPKIDGSAASILTPVADGKLEYLWGANDTEDPGDFDGEFEVLWSDGTTTTFPNFRYLRIKIRRSIDSTD